MTHNRPLITLQIGNYANYIGAHFWNLQEATFVYPGGNPGGVEKMLEVDHDVLYREGETSKREVTYTPRLVAVDLKGSLGLLPKEGDLYGRSGIPKEFDMQQLWPGPSQVFKEEPHRRNDFLREMNNEVMDTEEAGEKDIDKTIEGSEEQVDQVYNLDEQVSFWSDYLGTRFHPRSVLEVKSFQHENPANPFDMWGQGRQVWSDSVGEEVEDKVRCFAEECDMLGGLKVVADYHDGWGGFSHSLIDLLNDEYPGKSLLLFPCAPPSYPTYTLEAGLARLAGAALTISSNRSASNILTTPLSLAKDWFPLAKRHTTLSHLTYNPNLPYHSSALAALSLDTTTLPLRRRVDKPGSTSMSAIDMVQGLATHGRSLASLEVDIPMNFTGVDYFEEGRVNQYKSSLLPGASREIRQESLPHSSIVTVRGLLGSALYNKRSPMYSPCTSPENYLDTCLNRASPSLSPSTWMFTRPASTGKPFPHIFGPRVGSAGTVAINSEPDRDINTSGVNFVTAFTSLETGDLAGSAVSSLVKKADRLNLGKLHRLGESGVEGEEWDEAREMLHQLAECYMQDTDY